jgi:hypothetical protein
MLRISNDETRHAGFRPRVHWCTTTLATSKEAFEQRGKAALPVNRSSSN